MAPPALPCALDPSCIASGVTGPLVSAGTSAAVSAFAGAMRDAAVWAMQNAATWWLNIPSINIGTAPVGFIRTAVAFPATAIAVGGVIWAGIRMAISRKAEPLWDVVTGVVRLMVAAALGIIIVALLLQAGDSFSTWVVAQSGPGEAMDKLAAIASMGGVTSSGAMIFLGIVMFLAGVVQGILMLLREAGIVILTGVLVLAAAGSFTPSMKSWWQRVTGWLLALILFKPAAALVYAVAFTLIGNDTSSTRSLLEGVAMLLLAIVALPALMKFFTWAVPSAAGSLAGAGGGFAGAMGGLAMAAVAAKGLGGGASGHAEQLRSDMTPPPSGADPSPSPAASSLPTWAPAAASGATPAASGAAAGSGRAAAGAGAGAGPVAMGAIEATRRAKDAGVEGITGEGEG